MPYYLVQATQTPEAWARFVHNPEDRREALRATVESLGGALHGSWLAFSDYDAVFVYEMPDNARMASGAMAAAGGSLRAIKTTPLMTWEEGVEAMRGAAEVAYHPPGGGRPNLEKGPGPSWRSYPGAASR